ncbi:D-fructose-6-phosphate amidotransferase [Burkholderiales bacterium 8X]|nr:D-fructose-6-phosphate amidotransferase [Burkholderiales bacterium 8X]
MSAYCIANIEVHTPETYESYRRHTAGTLPPFGGRFLVRGGKTQVVEGSWQPARLVIIEFPSMDDLQAWYRSPAYQAIVGGRREGAHSEVVFVEGFIP